MNDIIYALSVAFAASLPMLSWAQVCNQTFYVASQDDLDRLGRDCPTVGSVLINGTYSGSLVLSGVTNIANAFRVAWWDDAAIPQITSIELTDLRHVDWIDLPGLTASVFSAPRLESLGSARLGQETHGSELHLPSLVQVGQSLQIIGNYSSVDLTSLETVNETLVICTNTGCISEYWDKTTTSAVNLTLSSLTSVSRLEIAGKTSSVSLPNLTTMTGYSMLFPEVTIVMHDTPASVSLPKLNHLEGTVKVWGAISSIDLSSISSTDESITIESSHPLNISFPITAVESLVLLGAIESVDLPNLQDFTRLSINSNLSLDCEPLDDKFTAISEESEEQNRGDYGRYSCKSTAEKLSSGLSTGVKAAIGVVVGVVGGAILAGLGFWWWKRKGKGSSDDVQDIDLLNTNAASPAGKISPAGSLPP